MSQYEDNEGTKRAADDEGPDPAQVVQEDPAADDAPPHERAEPNYTDADYYQVKSVFGVDYRKGPNWSFGKTGETAKFGTFVRVYKTQTAETERTKTVFIRTDNGWLPCSDDFGETVEKSHVQTRHRMEVIIAKAGNAQKLGQKDRYWRSAPQYRFIYDAVTQASANARTFQEGEVVQKHYAGGFCGSKGGWFDAEITAVNPDGTYDIHWKDSWRSISGVESGELRRELKVEIQGHVFNLLDSSDSAITHDVDGYPYKIVEIGPFALPKHGDQCVYIRPMIPYRKNHRTDAANIPFGTATDVNTQNDISIITGPTKDLMY